MATRIEEINKKTDEKSTNCENFREDTDVVMATFQYAGNRNQGQINQKAQVSPVVVNMGVIEKLLADLRLDSEIPGTSEEIYDAEDFEVANYMAASQLSEMKKYRIWRPHTPAFIQKDLEKNKQRPTADEGISQK